MKYFWSGYNLENFLFWDLNISSIEVFPAVLLAILSCSLGYEGVRTFRDILMNRFLKKRKAFSSQGNTSAVPVKFIKSPNDNIDKDKKGNDIVQIGCTNKEIRKEEISNVVLEKCSTPLATCDNIRSDYRLVGIFELSVSTFFHMVYVCLGYILMLAVMSFNVWILTAVGIGTGIGYFIFDVVKRKLV